MSESLENNPFSALFGSLSNVEDYRKTANDEQNNSCVRNPCSENDSIKFSLAEENEIIILEKLLLITTRKGHHPKFPCIFLDETPLLSIDTIDVVLFERLMLQNPTEHVVSLENYKGENNNEAEEDKVIYYLCQVYERCWEYKKLEQTIPNTVEISVVNNLKTALEQPDIFIEQDPHSQLKDLILNRLSFSSSFCSLLTRILQDLQEEGKFNIIKAVFEKVLSEVKKNLNEYSIMGVDWNMIDILEFYSTSYVLAPLLVNVLQDKRTNGRWYSQTALGSLLSISCLPRSLGQKCEFFENPSSQSAQTHKATESSIGVSQRSLQSRMCTIFLNILKVSPKAKDMLLKWIENCLEANSGRGGIWHIEAEELRSMSYVSDGFMINLCAILVHLSQPFIKDITDLYCKEHKVYKVDASYCFKTTGKEKISGLYSGRLPTMTPLIPKVDDESKLNIDLPDSYSFTTTCFYLTHWALHLGMQVVFQKMNRLSQDLGRIQNQLAEISGQDSPATEMMRKHMESKMTLFLSLKASGFENVLVEELLQFFAASCAWLVQIGLKDKSEKNASINFKEINLVSLQQEEEEENSELPNNFLQFIPEILMENIVGAITAVRRYSADALQLSGEPLLHHFMSFIAYFMGSPQRLNNPHLRANLAECLETLVPKENEVGMFITIQGRLFTQHPLAPHLVTSLIHVFVSIEMTGQSVAFEEKFNYRRPMYDVIKYLWEIPDHRKQFIQLASYALENMESAKTPLFLRFVNFLMNDAIFLLDEGLSFMAQIKENQDKMQIAEGMTNEQRTELQRSTQQMSMLARFHNMMGSSTIQTLIMLSKEIPDMFTHSTLVDRMAAMLNHFLNHLVGPKQRNLKVKDMEKYEFRPSEIVSDICTIYINLRTRRNFVVAIASDGRSYSPKLFEQACSVLIRIMRHALSEEIADLGKAVKEASKRRNEEEDLASSAPEEFLDPIMSSLMVDPVRLPSSQIIVDRQTIARHLLSDQTDPFNRQPLTMEEVVPEEALRDKIQEWLQEQRRLKTEKDDHVI